MLKIQTPFFFQKKLKELFIKELQKYKEFESKNGEKTIEVHEQFVPDNIDKKMPYVLIKLDSGEDDGQLRETKVFFIICIYDEDTNYSGYKKCMQLVERIYQFLARENNIDGFSLKYPLKWELAEENYYPYFFAGIETSWESAKVNMKDDEYC